MTKLSGTVKSVDVKTSRARTHVLKIEVETIKWTVTGHLKKHVERAQLLLGHLEPYLPNLLVGRKVYIHGEQHSDGLFIRRLQVAR